MTNKYKISDISAMYRCNGMDERDGNGEYIKIVIETKGINEGPSYTHVKTSLGAASCLLQDLNTLLAGSGFK